VGTQRVRVKGIDFQTRKCKTWFVWVCIGRDTMRKYTGQAWHKASMSLGSPNISLQKPCSSIQKHPNRSTAELKGEDLLFCSVLIVLSTVSQEEIL
jgi:hypothetical protein